MELPAKEEPNPGGCWNLRYRVETKSVSCNLQRRHGFRTISCRSILRNVSCEALPRELLAVVGPSGAGKTTLLSVLAGAIHPSRVSGEVLVNGRPMDVSRFRRVSGYVTQDDDALFPLLTVEESLAYSARLKLNATAGEAAARSRELLKDLGLDHVARSRVGGGISGGEKRRVSIGVEIVHHPAVLFLDEPTSGLDSTSALHIAKLLKVMATLGGKTVVLTLHQPGFRILELLDRVLLIAGGTVRHQGSVALLEARLKASGHCIPPHVNVLEFAMDAATAATGFDIETAAIPERPNCAITEGRIHYANSRCREIAILTSRAFKNASRTRELIISKLLQSIAAGFALGTIFMNARDLQSRVGFFAFSLTFLLSATAEALPFFLGERRILQRETSGGAYRVSSYSAASALVFSPFLLAAAVLFAAPVHWLVGLRKGADNFICFSLVVWLAMMMANSYVACFSAIAPDFVMGKSVTSGLMGCFFLFSGYFIAKERIPRYWVFMHYLSLFKYPFEVFVMNEYGGDGGRRECLEMEKGKGCVLDGGMLLKQLGVQESQRWSHVGVMLAFIFGYRIICLLFLWIRCHRAGR